MIRVLATAVAVGILLGATPMARGADNAVIIQGWMPTEAAQDFGDTLLF